MNKFLPPCLLIFLLTQACVADTPRFHALSVLPQHSREAFTQLMDWQRSFTNKKEETVLAQFGKPDKTGALANNSASDKPMHQIIYRLSRRSELQFTIHEGEVAAVAMVLVPSQNESGPIDD